MRPPALWGSLPVQPRRYGTSFSGQILSFVPAAETPRRLLLAGIHGEEPETVVLLSRALRMLEGSPRHTACVLSANPDGVLWGTRGNARGVDLNRNFPTSDWSHDAVQVRPWIEALREVVLSPGESPASEPETQALLRLIESLAPEALVSLHAPLACIDSPQPWPLARELGAVFNLPLQVGVGYPTPGSLGTWAQEQHLPCVTVELPRQPVEVLCRDYARALANWLE